MLGCPLRLPLRLYLRLGSEVGKETRGYRITLIRPGDLDRKRLVVCGGATWMTCATEVLPLAGQIIVAPAGDRGRLVVKPGRLHRAYPMYIKIWVDADLLLLLLLVLFPHDTSHRLTTIVVASTLFSPILTHLKVMSMV